MLNTFRHQWRGLTLAFATVFVSIYSLFFVPFMVERHSQDWYAITGRTPETYVPLAPFERYHQFSLDTPSWIYRTAGFPLYYSTSNLRIHRPVFPAVATIIPRLAEIAITFPDIRAGLTQPADPELTMASILLLNAILYMMTIALLYDGLKRHFSLNVAFLAALMAVFYVYWLININRAVTNVVGQFIFVAIIYLFDRFLLQAEKPRLSTIIWVSLVVGVLILTKAQYDGLMIAWAMALYVGRYRVVGMTALLHLIPTLIWIGIVAISPWTYENIEVTQYRQGVWLLDMLLAGQVLEIYPELASQIARTVVRILDTFSPMVLSLALVPFVVGHQQLPLARRLLVVFAFGVLLMFAAVTRLPKQIFNLAFIIYPLAAMGLLTLIHLAQPLLRRFSLNKTGVVAVLIGVFLVIDITFTWYYYTLPDESWVWLIELDQWPSLLELQVGW